MNTPDQYCRATGLAGACQNHGKGRQPALAFVLLALIAGAGTVAQANQLSYTNKTADSWTTASSWLPANNWSTGSWKTNATNVNLRLNFGSNANEIVTCTYDASMGTTILDVSPTGGENRAIGIGINAGSAAGTLNITGGTLRCIPEAGAANAVVILSGQSGMTTTNSLNVSGGTMDCSGGEIGILYRGSSPAWSKVTVSGGSLLADTISFCNFSGDGYFSGRGDFNLNGGTATVRTVKPAVKTSNYATMAVNINGGELRAATNSTVLLDVPTSGYGTGASVSVNLSNNAANTFTVPTNVTTAINVPMKGPGGFTKRGDGTLNLTTGSSFTGPITVNQGTLGVTMPIASSSVAVASGATFNLTPSNSPAGLASLALTNASLGFNYGVFNGYTDAVATVSSLALTGTIPVNLLGTTFPATNLTLLTYSSKTGSGSFTPGSLPAGAAAQLEDTGSALLLHITAPSVQSLVWSGGSDSTWRVNGAADWNGNTASYLEYPSGAGDLVTFDTTAPSSVGVVTLGSVVKPNALTVNNDGSTPYVFTGSGGISGATGLNKLGIGSLFLDTSNSYSGVTTISGGIVYVNNSNGLGSTAAGTIVNGPTNMLVVGSPYQAGDIKVSGETVTISGGGWDGVRGALRGSGQSFNNEWAGPVILGADASRIGTEDNGNLTVSGNITDLGMGYGVTLRPGTGGILTISGVSNAWSGTTAIYGGNESSKVVLGGNNALPVNTLLSLGNCVLDLNGHDQTFMGLSINGSNITSSIVANNGASLSTLTLNFAGSQGFPGSIKDGSSPVGVTKSGSGTQTLTGANTYTGPTAVNGGVLAVSLPMSSTALTVVSNATLSATVANSSWSSLSTLSANNATLNLNYGALNGVVPGTPTFTTANLNVVGNNVLNISGSKFPVGTITLISYSSKTGGGSFVLGTLPTGVQATLNDAGGAVVLNVTVSAQLLTWSGSATGTWDTTNSMDWNSGSAFYQEYNNNTGDVVSFDDSASVFTVNLANTVHPMAVTVSNATHAYSLSGAGKISGATGLKKLGTNTLTLATANDYDGLTVVDGGGTLLVTHSNALGSTVGITVVTNNTATTLALAGGVTVSGETVIIKGTGVGGARGALRGVDANTNTWAGPVIIAASTTRIGTEDNAKLTVAGPITDNGSNYNVLLRPGSNGVVTLSSPGTYGSATLFGDQSASGGLRLGTNNALATNMLTVQAGYVDLNGFDQALSVLSSEPGWNAVITNSGAKLSTLTVGAGATTNSSYALSIVDGASAVSLVKVGDYRLDLGGTSKYTGPTLINGGILRVSKALGATPVTVNSGGTLQGSGVIAGPVTVNSGGVLSPGNGAIGTLTVSNNLTLAGDLLMEVNKSSSTNDLVAVSGILTNAGNGTLTVANLGATALAQGDRFVLFNQPLANGQTLTINPAFTDGLAWANNLAVDGSISVVLAPPVVSSVTPASGPDTGGTTVTISGSNFVSGLTVQFGTNPAPTVNFISSTQITAVTPAHPAGASSVTVVNPDTQSATLNNGFTFNVSAPPYLSCSRAGTSLQFSWSGNFKLQAQTNTLQVGLSTNWGDYPGGNVSPVNVSADASRGCLFFRLVSQ